MKYQFICSKNGELYADREISADEMTDRIASVAVFLQCEDMHGMYEFHRKYDELYNFICYYIVLRNKGDIVEHWYYPIRSKKDATKRV